MSTNYQVCSRCVMDTTSSEIKFDSEGVCSFCKEYDDNANSDLHNSAEDQKNLENFFKKIKRKRKKNKYDCLIGVSGGVDSSYVAYVLKRKYNLNPLAIHLDNGWNSELAVSNVESLMKKLEIDLITHVLDWNEFKDIQLSFLKSSISNIEIPTDHAIWAILLRTASSMKIPYIIAGNNVVTESIMPKSWLYQSKDSKLIKSIYKKFGLKNKIKNLPMLSIFDFIYFLIFKRIKWIPLLNYIDFNKETAKNTLMQELQWRDYGGKHYESIFTRFFHSYYLVNKFGFDLRRPYLSALICSQQISREEALKELSFLPAEKEIIKADKLYVAKKLNLTESEFDSIINKKNKTFSDYGNLNFLWLSFSKLIKVLRRFVTSV